jgi:hypothetical protein
MTVLHLTVAHMETEAFMESLRRICKDDQDDQDDQDDIMSWLVALILN